MQAPILALLVVSAVSSARAAVLLGRVEALDDGRTGVRLHLDGAPVEPLLHPLRADGARPPRLTIDLPRATLDGPVDVRGPLPAPLLGVRTGQHDGYARVVLDVAREVPWAIEPTADGYAVYVDVPGSAVPRRRAAPPPPAPEPPPDDPVVPVLDRPTGFSGRSAAKDVAPDEMVPLTDRWRIGFPEHERYRGAPHEQPYARGHVWDPYGLNALKGDYPLLGQDYFLTFTARSDTLLEGRRLPIPSDVSSERPNSERFFGRGELLTLEQNFLLSFELFRGDAAFKPRDFEVRVTPVFNLNETVARERGVININPRRGTDRFDGHIAFEELFGDVKLADVSPYYDTVNLRAGIQGFTSDFRGFLFTDFSPGVKLSGNYAANRTQWHLAYFRQLEKDTNSALNTLFADREQDVAVADVIRQDFLWPGYATQLSLHYSHDHESTHYDNNGFLVRPASIGVVREHAIRTGYLGWTGDGHIDRINISHAFFWALGNDDFNNLAARDVFVNAQMAALELSYDRDWLRFKGSAFFASGDANPDDGTARGFDAIVDNPRFVGGPFSFWQRQGIKLTGTNVNLTSRFSLLPTLRSSKDEGQQNFVNPGIVIVNAGVAGRLTPKLSFDANVNYLRFHEVAPLQLALLQRHVGHEIGVDYSLGFRYRPLLIENIVVVVAVAGLTPLGGFRDIYRAATLWQVFTAVTLTY